MTPLFLQRILRRVFKNTELSTKFHTSLAEYTGSFPRPFITIAREPGSGGKPIGQEVAKRLGFEFFDQNLIDEIAKSTKLRKEVISKLDEKSRTAVQDFIQGLLNPNYVSDVTFVKHMTKVIVSLAYQGNTVILGRGANYLTPKDRGLHVRITAPLAIRIERAIQYELHFAKKARDVVREVGADRRDFVQQYFSKNIANSHDYDLVINTEFLSVDEAAHIIVQAYKQKFSIK